MYVRMYVHMHVLCTQSCMCACVCTFLTYVHLHSLRNSRNNCRTWRSVRTSGIIIIMHACMHACMYVCMYVCVCGNSMASMHFFIEELQQVPFAGLNVWFCMYHACVFTHVYFCIFVYVYGCVYVCIFVYVYSCTYVCRYVRMYVGMATYAMLVFTVHSLTHF